MSSLNKVFLMGNLTRDVDVKVTQTGLQVGRVGLAINDKVKRGSDYVDETTFVDCTLFGRTADLASQYLSKGSPVFFEGRLKFDQWEKDGQKHSKLSVIVDRMQFIGGKGGGGQSQGGGGGARANSYNVPKNVGGGSEEMDDIPF